MDAQAGQRRGRQERTRIDALAVDVLVALDERDVAERRHGGCCRPCATTKLSLRQAVAWLGGSITAPGGYRLLQLAQSPEPQSGSGERSFG
jgi:hypothetical protein